jgi:hypothetical protein
VRSKIPHYQTQTLKSLRKSWPRWTLKLVALNTSEYSEFLSKPRPGGY